MILSFAYDFLFELGCVVVRWASKPHLFTLTKRRATPLAGWYAFFRTTRFRANLINR